MARWIQGQPDNLVIPSSLQKNKKGSSGDAVKWQDTQDKEKTANPWVPLPSQQSEAEKGSTL